MEMISCCRHGSDGEVQQAAGGSKPNSFSSSRVTGSSLSERFRGRGLETVIAKVIAVAKAILGRGTALASETSTKDR